jgi:hypothetical protein
VTSADFAFNGIIGIDPSIQDCGSGCTTLVGNPGWYFDCASTRCTPTTVPLKQQVTNPVTIFESNNNGIILSMPKLLDSHMRFSADLNRPSTQLLSFAFEKF